MVNDDEKNLWRMIDLKIYIYIANNDGGLLILSRRLQVSKMSDPTLGNMIFKKGKPIQNGAAEKLKQFKPLPNQICHPTFHVYIILLNY